MTPSLILFLSVCAALAFFLGFVVIYPWMTGSRAEDNQLMAMNVATFYGRIEELEEDYRTGVIDEALYQAQVVELKRQLLAAQSATPMMLPASKKSRLIVLIWIPILVAMAYGLVGDRTPVFKLWQAKDTLGQVADELLTGKIDVPPEWATKDSSALISAMQVNVHQHAYDPQRWMRLSELFLSLNANSQTLEALSRAYRLDPSNEEIASTYAQIRFFSNEGQLDDTARKVIEGILTANPKHEGAMMLLAMGETRAGNFDEAKAWVARLRSMIAAKSGNHTTALESLDKLSATIEEQSAKSKQGIGIAVVVAPELLVEVQSEDTLFVSISDIQGGAPYAVQRLMVSELKEGRANVFLSDLNAMMADRTLSKAYQDNISLVAQARISKSGNAISQSGDLSANPVPIDKTTKSVNLSINQKIP